MLVKYTLLYMKLKLKYTLFLKKKLYFLKIMNHNTFYVVNEFSVEYKKK
jgi:hypothetical protein